jgi:hypothetical protein
MHQVGGVRGDGEHIVSRHIPSQQLIHCSAPGSSKDFVGSGERISEATCSWMGKNSSVDSAPSKLWGMPARGPRHHQYLVHQQGKERGVREEMEDAQRRDVRRRHGAEDTSWSSCTTEQPRRRPKAGGANSARWGAEKKI